MKSKILIVDDSQQIIDALTANLKSDLYEVISAASGRSGLQILNENPDIEIVITDFNMPDINGLKMIEEMRKIKVHSATRTLIMSTHSDSFIKTKAKELGVIGWLMKPFDYDALNKALEQFMIN